jgi:hypothetical protein
LKLKAKLESGSPPFLFQALSCRRFQLGFHTVNLHRHTASGAQLALEYGIIRDGGIELRSGPVRFHL